MNTTKETKNYITPPQLAKRWGVAVDKVLAYINNGSLIAINMAIDPNGQRPRYRITLEEIKRFEESRSSKPPEPKPRIKHSRKRKPMKKYLKPSGK